MGCRSMCLADKFADWQLSCLLTMRLLYVSSPLRTQKLSAHLCRNTVHAKDQICACMLNLCAKDVK